jgi:hypothetical protein
MGQDTPLGTTAPEGPGLAVPHDSELESQVEVVGSARQTAQTTLVRVKTGKARATSTRPVTGWDRALPSLLADSS